MNIVVRADASTFMGIGHVMRCLTLANALSEAGNNIHFVCREHQGHLGEKILAAGHALYLLPPPPTSIKTKPDPALSPPHQQWLGVSWKTDAKQTKEAIGDLIVDWLIVDHYALDARWESLIRSVAKRILVIDDLADRKHDCDELLDQTINQPETIYSGLVPNHCQLLVGSAYALLRSDFTTLRSKSLARRTEPSLKHLTIVFGGGDQSKHIIDALKSIQKSVIAKNVNITVVMAEDSRHYNQVNALSEKLPFEIEVLSYVDDMAQLMFKTDLVIGAAGGASLERCCLGVPTLLFLLAENQQANAQALSDMGAVSIIKDLTVDLKETLNTFVEAPQRLIVFSKAASELVDGKGTQRVMQRFQGA